VLRLIDSLEVCTTCGWTRDTHLLDQQTRTDVRCCAHWTRDL
jgi:hypothetical protein